MAIETIDFNKVIQYSKSNCVLRSKALCATYVKKAFEMGGCTYKSGNGWNNQRFCKENGFKCIGDFIPVDYNPRAHGNMSIQFPSGYVQQVGDICLIKHGLYGHICYATGTGINDWVSDYFQKSPGQQDNTGPYCYTGSVERVQFWRHSSVLDDTPVVTETPTSEVDVTNVNSPKESNITSSTQNNTPNSVQSWSSKKAKKSNKKGTVLGSHMNQR